MIDAAERLHLGSDRGELVGVGDEDGLERDLLAGVEVFAAIDGAHAACTDAVQNAEGSESLRRRLQRVWHLGGNQEAYATLCRILRCPKVQREQSWPLHVEKPLRRFAALAALLVLFLPATANAQLRAATAELVGRVVDQTQGVLPGALIAIVNSETGERQAQTTGPEGSFAFPPLPVGTYRIEASLSGFTTQVLEAVVLQVGNTTTLTLTLTISPTTKGSPSRRNAARGRPAQGVNTSISAQQIASLPINGRTFISFSTLAPGVTTDVTPDQGSNASSGSDLCRPAGEIEQHHARRPRQQRSRRRQRPRDDQPGRRPRVPGPHQLVCRRIRQGVGRRRQYRDQERRQRRVRRRVSVPARSRAELARLLREVRRRRQRRRPAEGAIRSAAVRRNARRTDGEKPRVLLRLGRAAVGRRQPRGDDRRHHAGAEPDRAGRSRHAAPRSCAAPDSSSTPAWCRFASRTTQLFGRADLNITPGQRLTLRANTGDEINENIEPFGGITAQSRAGALDSRDWMVAAMHG